MSIFNPSGYGTGGNNQGDRYGGGAKETTHRYVKGHFYVFFGFPTSTFVEDSGPAQAWVLGSAKSFTPPGDNTLNYVEDKGLGGMTSQVLTGVTQDTSFSLTFKEYWGSPLRKIFDKLGSYIDPHLGGSIIAKDFNPNEYKSTVFVVQTKPVARGTNSSDFAFSENDILSCYMFDGVVQTNNPSSMFGSDIEDSSLVELTMNFKFDGSPMTDSHPGVVAEALKCLKNEDMFATTKSKYELLISGITNNASKGAK